MSLVDIEQQLTEHIRTIELVKDRLPGAILDCVALLATALERGGRILTMGNGGSAADAQHLAAELVGRFLMERAALPAIAITTDSSILTALGNDYGFDRVFSRQVEALAGPGDVVFGITTSGNSENIRAAFEVARTRGAATVGLLGGDGGAVAGMVDLAITVPSSCTPRVQEAHLAIIHLLCDLLEKQLFPANDADKER